MKTDAEAYRLLCDICIAAKKSKSGRVKIYTIQGEVFTGLIDAQTYFQLGDNEEDDVDALRFEKDDGTFDVLPGQWIDKFEMIDE